ncbi:MAG: 2-oxo acid dehydrogenase subunit E2 [Bdellovibrionaceae bacterium]|nr:2-oxo acid dehydrogenase subunit E2 [Pseudobdellovibrionaceae bacterium]
MKSIYGSDKNYTIKSGNPMADAMRSIVDHELDYSVTVTFASTVDLTEVESLRAQMGDQRPSYTSFVCKALALALRDCPYANQRVAFSLFPFLFGTRRQQFHTVDISVFVEREEEDVENVTFIDTLRNADQLSLEDIQGSLKRLAQSTLETNAQWQAFRRLITLRPSWLGRLILRLPWISSDLWVKFRGGAASVSAPAKYGVDSVVASWPSPIGVSFGLVKKTVVVKNDKMVIAPTFSLVLNFDRRLMAGAAAARFFAKIVAYLENPASLGLSPQSSNPKAPSTNEGVRHEDQSL